MSFAVMIAVGVVVCTAAFGLLILALELTADFWFPDDTGNKNG